MAATGRLEQLTARQAAARLGVKIETIYAYVSRGLLERVPGADGRSSRFDARAVERLATRGRGGGTRTGGLGVVLGSAITLHEQDRLCYRGLDVAELARSTPYEAVAEWLWLGEVPPAWPTDRGAWRPWVASAESLAVARSALRALPTATPQADMLRIVSTLAGPTDPLRFDLAPRSVADSARRLIAALVDPRPSRSSEPPLPLSIGDSPALDDAIATRLWQRLTPEPASEAKIQLLNGLLVLVADHGLAASTLAARIAASVRADPYSVVSAGLGTLSGPLHGAASAPVHALLAEVGQPDRAVAVLGDFLRRQRIIPGFGHVIYEGWDPRARVMHELLVGADLDPERIEVVLRVLEILLDRVEVRPNIDFVLGALTWSAGMAEGAGETVFGVARAAGWIAHALEEYEEPPLRFRARAHYSGRAPGGSGPGSASLRRGEASR